MDGAQDGNGRGGGVGSHACHGRAPPRLRAATIDLAKHAAIDGSLDALLGLVAYVRNDEPIIAQRGKAHLWVHPSKPNRIIHANPDGMVDVLRGASPADR